MNVILRGRQEGKTAEIIRLASENFAYIVCADKRRVMQIWGRVREMGLMDKMPQPITWDDFIQGRYYPAGIKGFLIDDLDACVQSVTAVPVLAVSLNDASGTRFT